MMLGLIAPLGMAAVVTVTPVSNYVYKVTETPDQPPTQAVVIEQTEVTDPTAISKINEEDGTVSFYTPAGELLLRQITPIDNESEIKTVSFLKAPGAHLYGAGERGHSLTYRNDSLTLYNRQNYGYTEGDPRISQMGISVPWIVSDNGYGLFFDDYAKGAIEIKGDTITYQTETQRPITYYFVKGVNMADAMSGYADLTGRQPLPPFWALGYITSKYGYHTQDETLGVVDTLKTRGYPVDGVVLDLYWYGVETDMGRLEWNKQQWPDHKGMLDSLRSLGVNTVLISQPYINKIGAIDNYNLLDSLGMLTHDAEGKTHDVTTWVGEAGMFDMANPATREWLWNRLRPLTEEGVAGWWGDLGEPEVHPTSIVHANGETAEQYHNVYGNVWSKLIYDGLRKDFPDMRPLLMMRGGTAGLQRYGVMPWTTDVSRSWGGLQPQVKLMLSAGLSGLGYMSSDIGGFAVDPDNPTDEELYIRWLQMGAFTPTLRTHAQLLPEPYHYPAIEDIAKKYIRMRYEWLPYNYTLAAENAEFGFPLARPLNFYGENPEDKYADIADEYMWGDEVLVAPIMQQGAVSRKVLFPKGEWIDFFDPLKRYKGGSEAVVDAPLDKLPLFVKAGSFIPLYLEPISNVGDYYPKFLTVRYYPSPDMSSYTMYEDDRKSPTSIDDKNYQLINFRGYQEKSTGTIYINLASEGGYEGMPDYRSFTMQIIDVKKPDKVMDASGKEFREVSDLGETDLGVWGYDKKTKTLTLRFPWSYGKYGIGVFY